MVISELGGVQAGVSKIAPGGDGASREVPGTVPGKDKTGHHHTGLTSPRERALALTVFSILKSHRGEVGRAVSESPPPLWNVFPSSFEGGGTGQLRSE